MDWIDLITKAEKGSNLTSAEADSIVSAVRQLQDAVDEGLTTFSPRGAWMPATAYALGDLVEIGGSSYVCALAHTSTTVFADDLAAGYWQLVAERGAQAVAVTPRGEWDSGTAYVMGDMVSKSSRLYVAVGNSTNIEPPNEYYWEPLRSYQELYGVDISNDVTLSMGNWQDNTIFYLSGTLTDARTLTVPDLAKMFVVRGEWDGDYPVTVKTVSGVGFEIESGDQVIATNTGADVVAIFSAFAGEALDNRVTVLESSVRPLIEGSESWTPGAISTTVSTTVSVPGAVVGDFVQVSYSAALGANIQLTGSIDSSGSATVVMQKISGGGSVTPAPGTVRVLVTPKTT